MIRMAPDARVRGHFALLDNLLNNPKLPPETARALRDLIGSEIEAIRDRPDAELAAMFRSYLDDLRGVADG